MSLSGNRSFMKAVTTTAERLLFGAPGSVATFYTKNTQNTDRAVVGLLPWRTSGCGWMGHTQCPVRPHSTPAFPLPSRRGWVRCCRGPHSHTQTPSLVPPVQDHQTQVLRPGTQITARLKTANKESIVRNSSKSSEKSSAEQGPGWYWNLDQQAHWWAGDSNQAVVNRFMSITY